MAMFFHSKHKNISMDSRDTRADPQRVKAKPWSIDLIILLLFGGSVYKFYLIHFIGPFND